MTNICHKIILIFLLFLPLTANAIADKDESNIDQEVERHLQQLDASWKAEIHFLQSITDEASVAGRENELFDIYKVREKHQQALINMARKSPRSEASESALKKMMNIRLGADDAIMKELLRLKDNTRISALRTEAHERSRSNKKPEMTLERVLVAGKLADSDAPLLNDQKRMLDQIEEDLAQRQENDYQ